MELIFFGIVGWFVLLGIGVAVTPMLAHKSNKKEKERKLALMRANPHLAREIWQSIEDQDAHHRAQMDAYGNGIGTAFEKAGASVQKATARRTNSHRAGAIVRMGIGMAKKLAK
jgi:hypothetical protein